MDPELRDRSREAGEELLSKRENDSTSARTSMVKGGRKEKFYLIGCGERILLAMF